MDLEFAGLTKELKAFALQRGADLVGIADLAPVRNSILSQGGTTVASFPHAVSIGMRLSDTIIDTHKPTESQRESLYWHHVYNVVSVSLDLLANDVGRWLSDRGFATLSVPASMPYNLKTLQGMFSHKMGARLAGLGWIGKSSLLLTEQFGPRVRFVTVLTNAPLEAGSMRDQGCGACTVCVDTCPVGAFTGADFNDTDDLAIRFNAAACCEYRRSHACGVCVANCPRGAKNSAVRQSLR